MAAAVLKYRQYVNDGKGFFCLQNFLQTLLTRHLRLIDDSHHIQTSNGSSILGGLTLGIIEVGRNSDHSMCNLRKQVTLI